MQSEIVVDAVLHSVPSHLLERFMTAMVPFLSERD